MPGLHGHPPNNQAALDRRYAVVLPCCKLTSKTCRSTRLVKQQHTQLPHIADIEIQAASAVQHMSPQQTVTANLPAAAAQPAWWSVRHVLTHTRGAASIHVYVNAGASTCSRGQMHTTLLRGYNPQADSRPTHNTGGAARAVAGVVARAHPPSCYQSFQGMAVLMSRHAARVAQQKAGAGARLQGLCLDPPAATQQCATKAMPPQVMLRLHQQCCAV